MRLEAGMKMTHIAGLLVLAAASSFASVTATKTVISSALNPSVYGQTVTFSAVVSSSKGAPPDGETVSFLKGNTVLGTGTLSVGSASFTTSTLAGGTVALVAMYAGDSNFGSSRSATLKQVVSAAPTTISLASSENPSNVGQAITFTANVASPQFSGPLTGSVTFYNGSKALGTVALSGGVAEYMTATLPAGSDAMTAVYRANTSFSGSTSSVLNQTVGAGTFIDSTMTWDGIERYYSVFAPTALAANPPMLLMLHGTWYTADGGADATGAWNVTGRDWGWQSFANQYGFILVQPASTWDPSTKRWNWNAYFMDGAFPAAESGTCTEPPATGCPDDAGFLRNLIGTLTAQYNVNPNQIYVTGFSSGAQMAERVGVEISDLVAAIAPVSGQLEGQLSSPPPVLVAGNAVAPISVQAWQGTADNVLWPCGYRATTYNGVTFTLDTVDDTFNYWVTQNGCTTLATNNTLCSGSTANPAVSGNLAAGCTSNTEVQFVWEEGVSHLWKTGNIPAIWNFLSTHQK
jgi:poly(3-hydroxybutyrate) depolymerase